VLGLLASLLAFWLTEPPGPGLDPDSMSYLGAAVSVAEGRGLRIPTAGWSDPDSTSELKAFPPGYSLALAVPIRLGIAPQTAARGVQAAAAGVTVGTIASLALSLAGPWAAVLVTGLLLLTPALVEDHLSVLSEPLYLMLQALFLLLLIRQAERPLRYGVVAALAAGVRYLGGSLVAAGVLWALCAGGSWTARLRRAMLAALPALVLGIVWVLAVRGTPGPPPATSLVADLHLDSALAELREALVLWLGPGPEDAPWTLTLALVTGVLFIAVLIRHSSRIPWPRWRNEPVAGLWLAAGLITLGHFGVLLFSRVFVGHEIPFDSRLLSPVMLLFELLVAVAIVAQWDGFRVPQRAGAVLVLLAWSYGAQGWLREEFGDAEQNGWDYNQLLWRNSPVVAWARGDSGRRYVLFSNHPVPLWFHAGRPSRNLPESLDPDTVAAFARTLAAQHGAVIALADTSWAPEVKLDSLAAAVPLRVVARFGDGVVYEGPLAVSR